MADALQDIASDPERWMAWRKKRREKVSEQQRPGIFEEYVRVVDINLVKSGMAFKASKSVEFGRTDQSMLSHIRNGILFLLRFNQALQKLDIRALDETELRECIALFVVHDLHKLAFYENDRNENDSSVQHSAKDEFELSDNAVTGFVEEMHLAEFAPGLLDEDYFSVAVALHKSRYSRPGARTSRFMDLEPFLYLMDSLASCSSPEEAISARSLTALRDGFPQTQQGNQLTLQYHRLDDVKGILTGLLNSSVAEVLEEQGLIMLMAYQDGCVYLGKGMKRADISENLIDEVFHRLEKNILEAAPALPDKMDLQGPQNCYRLSDEYFFFSGPEKMVRAFLEMGLTTARMKKSDLSKAMERNINRALNAASIEPEASDARAIIEVARVVNAIRKSFVSELADGNAEEFTAICDIWGVPDDLKKKLQDLPEDVASELTSGGKWEYAYAIAWHVIEAKHDGVALKNLPPLTSIDVLFEMVWPGLTAMDGWDELIFKKKKAYRDELNEYIHNVLSVNGTLFRLDSPGMSDPFREYQKGGSGGRLCDLCNNGTLRTDRDEMKQPKAASFLEFNFSNRIFMGTTKPDNIHACVPCGVELVLRLNGCDLTKEPDNEKLYFHLIPDYFFTPESWELAHNILTLFSGEARVHVEALSELVFKSMYSGGSASADAEVDVDVYNPWIKALRSGEDEGAKGRNIFQYMGQGYGNAIGDACVIFYKPFKNTTEFHFFGVYIALVIAAYTGMRVVVSKSPITVIRARDFKEFVALEAVDSHVTDFYGKFVPLSGLECALRSASALIRLGYACSGLVDSMFSKYLRVVRNEPLPGSHLLKMVYRHSNKDYAEKNVKSLLDEALFLDKMKLRR